MNITLQGLTRTVSGSQRILDSRIYSILSSPCVHCHKNQIGISNTNRYIAIDSIYKIHKRHFPYFNGKTRTNDTLLKTNKNVITEFEKSLTRSSVPLRLAKVQPLIDKRLLTQKEYGVFCHRDLSLTPKDILNASPKGLQPYLRLIRFDKPIGTWLLYWPCTWSIGLASYPGQLPDLWLLALFGAGSFFMRGAGCIINDMWDKDIDRKVERTKLRPLASGELSNFQGLCCLGGMLSVSLLILLQLNWYSVCLGAASMILVIMYPLAKRVTFWPQAMLGMTFNYGTMLGWAAVTGGIDWTTVLPLYISCMAWTLSYDTIYAHQDKYDDMLIGVKSTALKFGDQTKIWLSGFGSIMIGGLALTGLMCDQKWPYFTGLTLTAVHIAHQLYTVDLNNADDCAAKFRSNTSLGMVMFLGIVIGNLLKKPQDENSEDFDIATEI